MATTTTITTSYAGEKAAGYVSAALLTPSTITSDAVTVMPNIKYKQVLKSFDDAGALKGATCDFTADGTVTLAERYIEPKQLELNRQFCKDDFRSDWEAIEMGYSSHDVLPKSFSDYILGFYAGKAASSLESMMWSGVAGADAFDGWATIAANDANLPAGQKVTGAAITATNVIAELGKLVDAIPETVYGSEGLTLYVSSSIARAYVRALGGFAATIGANGVDNKGTQWYNNGALSFDGLPIFVAKGLTGDKAIAATKDNMRYGCSVLSDTSEVKLIDMSMIDGSDNVRVAMKMAAAVNFAVIEDVTTYGI